jgi:anti-sigma regulatory factor (Ser/Thr protein kinase)
MLTLMKAPKPMQTAVYIPAQLEQLITATQTLREILTHLRIPEEIIRECEQALQALLENLIERVYIGDSNHLIKIDLSVATNRLVIEAQDASVPETANLKMAHPMAELLTAQADGYGMATIMTLMDEVSYRNEGGKNIWKLVKVISP